MRQLAFKYQTRLGDKPYVETFQDTSRFCNRLTDFLGDPTYSLLRVSYLMVGTYESGVFDGGLILGELPHNE